MHSIVYVAHHAMSLHDTLLKLRYDSSFLELIYKMHKLLYASICYQQNTDNLFKQHHTMDTVKFLLIHYMCMKTICFYAKTLT